LPVCETIHRIVGREACIFPQESYDAQALRALIGECRFLVASRFHAMVSGLATGVPTALVGWSHKYREVLADFELEDYAIDHASLSEGALRELFARLERDEAEIRERIRRHLPGVMESSLGNARLAAELLAPAAEGSGP
jgi:polysaccharide pyruvyl transferase WcaK-like protein